MTLNGCDILLMLKYIVYIYIFLKTAGSRTLATGFKNAQMATVIGDTTFALFCYFRAYSFGTIYNQMIRFDIFIFHLVYDRI